MMTTSRYHKVTVVMYHYVRYLTRSRYPDIKGLEADLFREQVTFLKSHYNFITVEQLIEAYAGNYELPRKAALLTFDDGYVDHYTVAFPILSEMGIQGAFYPPVKTIVDHQVLDVNKIHFILASSPDKKALVKKVQTQLDLLRTKFNLNTNNFYYQKLAKESRYDTADVIYVKRLLQVELDEAVRLEITDNIFKDVVSIEESAFSTELYMSEEQLKVMLANGMHVGSHGYNHYWLNSLTPEQQLTEVTRGMTFLKRLGVDMGNWTICYPYGAYNESLLDILSNHGCKLGFTTRVAVAEVGEDNSLEIPRLDTNDLPKDSKSVVDDLWYPKG
jgi:peptidoglycan/xylan/chitin deacetylase (PgdA/CDA1 family)